MNNKKAEWVLRIVVALEFLGHGIFALQGKPHWIKYFTAVGISAGTAPDLMFLIGLVDITLAVIILVRPIKVALLWMSLWAFMTATIRPIAGEHFLEFVERAANWGAPLALLLLLGWPKKLKDWIS